MDRMKDFPFEFTKPYSSCFDLLHMCNLAIFDDDIPFIRKYSRFIFTTFCVILQGFAMFFYLISMFTGQLQISELAFVVTNILLVIQVLIGAAIFISNKTNIQNVISCLAGEWRTENLNEVQIERKTKLLKRLNVGNKVFNWITRLTLYETQLMPITVTLFRKLIRQDVDLLLPLPSVYPFNPVENWLRYITVHIFQSYCIIFVGHLFIAIKLLIIIFYGHLSTEFALLREDLKHVTPNKNKHMQHGSTMTLEKIIEIHQNLTKFTKLLNNIFGGMVFIDLLFATATICLFAFDITVADDVVDKFSNFICGVTLLVPIYIVCNYGELMNEESSGIADSAYENLWYNEDAQYQKSICLIILRAQRPCCLTALSYVPVTLNTFTQVLKTTWSYFSLATTMYNKE